VRAAGRVTASGRSAMSLASTTSRSRIAPSGAQIAASHSPVIADWAAAPLDSESTTTAVGTWSRSQCRHWALACGCAATERIAASGTPARAPSTNWTGSTTSRVMTSGSPSASSSRVTPTWPPIEFSSGTSAASASPPRTASSASGTLCAGVRVPCSAAGMVRSACSVNVPSGPR
jgi:hypothetical protein